MANRNEWRNAKEPRIKALVLNKKYFLNYDENHSVQQSSFVSYGGVVLKCLEYFEENSRDIKQVGFDEIKIYINKKKPNVNNVFKAALQDFFTETEKFTGIAVDLPNMLKQIQDLEDTKQRKRVAKPLSILQIIEIRNKLKEEKYYELLFTFEMVYVHGITWPEFSQFKIESYTHLQNTFTFISSTDKTKITKVIKLCKTLKELIENHPKLLKGKKARAYIADMNEISKKVAFKDRDKVIWQDVEKTRKDYFPTCPKCEEKYPNTAEFWSVVEFIEDVNKNNWLFCRNCAMSMDKMEKDQ